MIKSFKSTGVLRIILTCMGRTIMPLYLFMGLVYLASGLLLAYGATKVIIELILEYPLNVVCFSKNPN